MAARTLYYEGEGRTLSVVSEILRRRGYAQSEWKYSMDGGAGWAGSHYWIEIEEGA